MKFYNGKMKINGIFNITENVLPKTKIAKRKNLDGVQVNCLLSSIVNKIYQRIEADAFILFFMGKIYE